MTATSRPQLPPEFLAAIRERPDDDNPRRRAANWLAEHGDGVRAEFIRVQCDLARCPVHGAPPDFGTTLAYACDCEEFLVPRERELLNTVAVQRAFPGLSQVVTDEADVKPGHLAGIARRGFVEVVIGPATRFLAWADRLLATTPPRLVKLTTRPLVHTGPGGSHRLQCRSQWWQFSPAPEGEPALLATLLAVEFPGVDFELPE